MKKIHSTILLVIVMSFCFSCKPNPDNYGNYAEDQKVNNIVKITSGNYSHFSIVYNCVIKKSDDPTNFGHYLVGARPANIRIIEDVPPGQPMWLEQGAGADSNIRDYLKIHVRSFNDIDP